VKIVKAIAKVEIRFKRLNLLQHGGLYGVKTNYFHVDVRPNPELITLCSVHRYELTIGNKIFTVSVLFQNCLLAWPNFDGIRYMQLYCFNISRYIKSHIRRK
jgi:hypothetical protein